MKTSKYKYVFRRTPRFGRHREQPWVSCVPNKFGSPYTKDHKEERDAAIWVDKLLIGMGKQPVNILKRKE